MQSIQNLKENIFSECKKVIEDLSKTQSLEDFLPQFDKISALHEKALFLKNFDLFNSHVSVDLNSFEEQNFQINQLTEERENLKAEYWELLEEKNAAIENLELRLRDSEKKEEEIEALEIKIKEAPENFMLNEFVSEEPENNSPVEDIAEIIADNSEVFQEKYADEHQENVLENQKLDLESVKNDSPVAEIAEIISDHAEAFQAEYEQEHPDNSVETKEPIVDEFESVKNDHYDSPNISTESTEDRRHINEFDKKQSDSKEPEITFEDFKSETVQEKKFRLGKIKGLSMVKSLFDDDLEDLEPKLVSEKQPLQKSNMSTEFMEAGRPKIDFRIDLNDKVAFTKLLFKGDEDELRATVNQLNSYKTLDEAKEYLSELYYKKDWKTVDDYAQRLWVLVENKFI